MLALLRANPRGASQSVRLHRLLGITCCLFPALTVGAVRKPPAMRDLLVIKTC